MTYKFGFVILHYLSVEDTIECVESIIKNIDIINYKIFIVDNHSPDHSGNYLINKYIDNERVCVILNEKNLGFSRGNNRGITIAKEQNCDFIIVLNNDTVLFQTHFTDAIVSEYHYSKFGVLGPKVLDPDGINTSSPLSVLPDYSASTLYGNMKIWRRKYYKCMFGLEYLHRKKTKPTIEIAKKDTFDYDKRAENVEIHGCCLIFSPRFFNFMDGFEELTFMYGEESILKMNCDKYNLPIIYNPELEIFHKEAITTKKERRNRKGQLAFYKRMWKAAEAIYKKAKKRSNVCNNG